MINRNDKLDNEESEKQLNKKLFEIKMYGKEKDLYKHGSWEHREARKQQAYSRKSKYKSW